MSARVQVTRYEGGSEPPRPGVVDTVLRARIDGSVPHYVRITLDEDEARELCTGMLATGLGPGAAVRVQALWRRIPLTRWASTFCCLGWGLATFVRPDVGPAAGVLLIILATDRLTRSFRDARMEELLSREAGPAA